MKNFIIGLLFLCGFYACSSGKENISEVDCAQYVNPFIGNPVESFAHDFQ